MLCLFSNGAETETTLKEAYKIYVTAENGQVGSSAELILNMKNRTAISTWVCTLVLPEGVTFREASPYYDSGRYPEGNAPIFNTTVNNDGSVFFTCTLDGEDKPTFSGTDGAVAVVTVDIASTVAPNNYDIIIRDAKLLEPNDATYVYDEQKFTWTIEENAVTYGTITFDLNGAVNDEGVPVVIDPITVPVGDPVFAPEDPVWTGHTFTGWEPVVPETMPEGGLTCVAQWEIQKLNVFIVEAPEGAVTVSDMNPEYGSSVTITINEIPGQVLESLLVNQVDVTENMTGNTYVVDNIEYDVYVWARFRTTHQIIAISQEYTPFSCSEDLDFTDSDLKAYIASGFNKANNQAILVRVTDVPANTGVLLMGQVGETYNVAVNQSSTYYVNLFKPFIERGWLTPTDETGANYNYVFGEEEGDPGFYPLIGTNGVEMPGCSAYLQLPASEVQAGVKVSFIMEEDVIDGVSSVAAFQDGENVMYNVAGQRLSKMQKGINIVGGKKILVK